MTAETGFSYCPTITMASTYGIQFPAPPKSALDQLREKLEPTVKETPKRPRAITDKVVLEIVEELEGRIKDVDATAHEALRGAVYTGYQTYDQYGKPMPQATAIDEIAGLRDRGREIEEAGEGVALTPILALTLSVVALFFALLPFVARL